MTIRSLSLAAVAVLALGAASVHAQEVYSLPAGSGNVATLSVVIAGQNGDICQRWNLARTCTQAQVCAAAAAPGGSSCTATQARTAGVRIYAITQAGREEFVTFAIALPRFLEMVSSQQSEERRAFCEGWAAASVSTRNTFCTTIGLASGCNPGC